MYKGAITYTSCPLHSELDSIDDVDQLLIEVQDGSISEEWITGWWLKQLDRGLPSEPTIGFVGAVALEDNEDLYA